VVSKPVFSVAVRELVDFALRCGDLGGARDFVGPNRALAGTRGHQRLQRSRPAGYQKEVRLCHELDAGPFILRIQGRIDGLLSANGKVLLEEIKTVQRGWDHTPDPLHWAQAKVYGFIYAREQLLDSITIQLAYLDLESGELTEFREDVSVADLAAFFESTTEIYLAWLRERHAWNQTRNQSIGALAFPFARYRAGQRELAVAAYRALDRGGRLFLEAPTGIGKTMAVFFPAVKALAGARIEQIFYLTARTVGRETAQKAVGDLRAAGLRLRVLTLTARDKLCVRDGVPCDLQTCPLARGYYDRRKPAMRAALSCEDITRAALEEISREHQVCPSELSLDLCAWVDAVICDYNYVFDPAVYLRRRFSETAGDYAFLVDEAHNLVDRAREMFSATLNFQDVQNVRRAIKIDVPRCAKALGKLGSALRKLSGSADSFDSTSNVVESGNELGLFAAGSGGPDVATVAGRLAKARDYRSEVQVSREFPEHLLPLIDDALKHAESWLAQNQPAAFRQDLLDLYFQLFSFRRTAELFDERYATIIEPGAAGRLRLFCLDPSFLLRQAMARGKTTVFFSATLTPLDYYRALLGGVPEDPVLQLASPFPPGNLAVLVHDRLRTHLKARAETLGEVAEAVAALVRGRPGNYLVYLPSYNYLGALEQEFRRLDPRVTILAQRTGMSEAERDAFLAAFAIRPSSETVASLQPPAETLVGFAVLGGIFGEGIDLAGDRLIGVVVVGVGLPQLCAERDLIHDYFQERKGAGFAYAYTFPGMNRVLQATGRVIRSESDRGVVLLIDARFGHSAYKGLFPGWWQARRVRTHGQINDAVRSFWMAYAEVH
jgi:DNA excision repair protein ERCC-2